MKQVIINGEIIFTKGDLYQPFIDTLVLPAWQGHNLDALWDTLSVWSEPLEITVRASGILLATLGPTGQGFLELLEDLVAENPLISIIQE